MMNRSVFALLASLTLVGCATPIHVHRVPARDAKLAEQGWEQSATPFSFGAFGLKAEQTLTCRRPSCGGEKAYISGSGTISPDTAFGHDLQVWMDSPAVDTGMMREGLNELSNRQNAGQALTIEDIQKVGHELHITMNGRQRLSGGHLGFVLVHLTAAGNTLRFEATLAADRETAQELFRLQPLAH
jgi:hypothetical protein